jgi:hypothetical protein
MEYKSKQKEKGRKLKPNCNRGQNMGQNGFSILPDGEMTKGM